MHHLRFWLGETLSHFACARASNLVALVCLAAILWFLGAGGLFLSQMRRTIDAETSRLELVMILDKQISPARRRQIFEAARIKAVKKLDLTLASAALKRYSQNLKLPADDLRATNPLGDELRVELHDSRDFWRVRAYLTSIKGVIGTRNANAGASLPALIRVYRTLSLGALGALSVGFLALAVLVHAALRRTVRARHREIQVMKLVGATPAFIRAPFWIQGALLGASGAVLALLGLNAWRFGWTVSPGQWLEIAAILLALGVFAGLGGAWLALRRVGYEVAPKSKARARVVV